MTEDQKTIEQSEQTQPETQQVEYRVEQLVVSSEQTQPTQTEQLVIEQPTELEQSSEQSNPAEDFSKRSKRKIRKADGHKIRRKLNREKKEEAQKTNERSVKRHVEEEAKYYKMKFNETTDALLRCLAKLGHIPTWWELSYYTEKSIKRCKSIVCELIKMKFLTKTSGNKKSIKFTERGLGWVYFNVR